MITKEVAAVLALRVYDQQPNIGENLPLEPQGRVKLTNPLPVTDGFAYGVFRNATTNEVVIAYRGTDGVVEMTAKSGSRRNRGQTPISAIPPRRFNRALARLPSPCRPVPHNAAQGARLCHRRSWCARSCPALSPLAAVSGRSGGAIG